MTTQTSCKPSDRCARCRGKTRRYVETEGKKHRFFHHLGLGMFEDCEDQNYERVHFGAYENKVKL